MAHVVVETASGVWSYHIRDDRNEPSLGGGRLVMLCGVTRMAWDTKIPLTYWGSRSHLHEKYCAVCTAEALKKGIISQETLEKNQHERQG